MKNQTRWELREVLEFSPRRKSGRSHALKVRFLTMKLTPNDALAQNPSLGVQLHFKFDRFETQVVARYGLACEVTR